MNEPVEGLGEDALTGDAVLREDGIQARLGGVGLPATIEQSDEAFADLSDLVSVEADDGDAFFCVEVNRGVSLAPVLALGDCGVHLGFDLAHGWFGVSGVGVVFPSRCP